MTRQQRRLIIDARPRGPHGPLAEALVLGRPVLRHLMELAAEIQDGPVFIHTRLEEQARLRALVPASAREAARFVIGPPPQSSSVLLADRLYDPKRLSRILRRGRDPESAVIWRLDSPAGLQGADDELIRRRSYQPLGRYWALAPARWLARSLRDTHVRPNALTIASGMLMLSSSVAVGFGSDNALACWGAAASLALALILDTADGHLARLQGTATAFGRWLDANLDEVGDMALHAAAAWACFRRDALPFWLLAGIAYAIAKYLFFVGSQTWDESGEAARHTAPARCSPTRDRLRFWAGWIGHADVRWHLWIVLTAIGRLDGELILYTLYYLLRVVAGAWRKAVVDA